MRRLRKYKYTCVPALLLTLALSGCTSGGENQIKHTEESSQETKITNGQTKTEAISDKTTSGQTEETSKTVFSTGRMGDDYILPDATEHTYTAKEVSVLTAEELRIARNEIYAQHGRKFKSDDLIQYFTGKSWYHGSIEPDTFDESLLNPNEVANLKLIKQVETAMRESEDNTTACTAVTEAYAVIGEAGSYADIVKKNQYRQLYLSTEERMGENEEIRSQIIDHGSYYEVTHCVISANTCYELDVVDGKDVGDTLQLGDAVYRITGRETWCLENGENVFLDSLSGSDYYALSRYYSQNYYILLGEDAEKQTDILYKGNLYYSKNCITTVNDPDHHFKEHIVSISDYFTAGKYVVGSQLGLHPSGSLVMWGAFEIDSTGLIIRYTEFFLS